ncbi:MAG: hypothetical protein M1830_010742 [Pleopsidium flavum]|nr:MAG: hypothetical protein M1830_010742 [Pleopsidium flavum]
MFPLSVRESGQIDLLRRQYLQLLEPDLLAIPSVEMLRKPNVQQLLYNEMFNSDNSMFAPTGRYQLRVLKELVLRLESSFTDPEEDEISDELMACLTTLMASPTLPPSTAALQKSYVTYTTPMYGPSSDEPSAVTTLESPSLLSSSGATGLRTWPAALSLGTYLASHTGKACVDGKNILELGAGTGFLSIFCAKHAGALHVLATDGDGGAVDDIGANIYLNGLEGSGKMETAVLKWGHALIEELLSGQNEGRTYDVVLGADVIYDIDAIPALVATLLDLFNKYPRIEALIAATVRNENTLKAFINACNTNNFYLQDVGFHTPPMSQQSGFFHPTTTQIRILCIKNSRAAKVVEQS